MSELHQRLRQLRIESGKSQSEVGDCVGVSRSAVTQIEAGNREVSAGELLRFASVFRQSPSALLAGVSEPSQGTFSELSTMLDGILKTHAELNAGGTFRARLERLLQRARLLTEFERHLGADVFGPEAAALRGVSPRTAWQAAHQGHAAADEERRRLDLGSAPIRDIAQTLSTLRVRSTRLALPNSTPSVFMHTPETGALIIVNEGASEEERRFWLAHGYAHALFDRERQWIVCSQEERGHHHEVRASAFASRFLIPGNAVERYLQSIGRDTMAQTLGGALDLIADTAAVPADESRIRLSTRSWRRALQLNAYELFQVAHYFGVSASLVAHALRNHRLLSGEERDRLTGPGGDAEDRAPVAAVSIPRCGAWSDDALSRRLLALAAEVRRRGDLAVERIESVAALLDLNDEEKELLLGIGDDGASRPPTQDGVELREMMRGENPVPL